MESYQFNLESAPGSGEFCTVTVVVKDVEYTTNHDEIAGNIYDALSQRTDFDSAFKTVDSTTAFTS